MLLLGNSVTWNPYILKFPRLRNRVSFFITFHYFITFQAFCSVLFWLRRYLDLYISQLHILHCISRYKGMVAFPARKVYLCWTKSLPHSIKNVIRVYWPSFLYHLQNELPFHAWGFQLWFDYISPWQTFVKSCK